MGKTVDEAEKAVMNFSMYPLPPALAKFPFLGTHQSVDILAIFWVEAIYTLSLSVGRLIKQCQLDMLFHSTRTTFATESIGVVQNHVNQFRKLIRGL